MKPIPTIQRVKVLDQFVTRRGIRITLWQNSEDKYEVTTRTPGGGWVRKYHAGPYIKRETAQRQFDMWAGRDPKDGGLVNAYYGEDIRGQNDPKSEGLIIFGGGYFEQRPLVPGGPLVTMAVRYDADDERNFGNRWPVRTWQPDET